MKYLDSLAKNIASIFPLGYYSSTGKALREGNREATPKDSFSMSLFSGLSRGELTARDTVLNLIPRLTCFSPHPCNTAQHSMQFQRSGQGSR